MLCCFIVGFTGCEHICDICLFCFSYAMKEPTWLTNQNTKFMKLHVLVNYAYRPWHVLEQLWIGLSDYKPRHALVLSQWQNPFMCDILGFWPWHACAKLGFITCISYGLSVFWPWGTKKGFWVFEFMHETCDVFVFWKPKIAIYVWHICCCPWVPFAIFAILTHVLEIGFLKHVVWWFPNHGHECMS